MLFAVFAKQNAIFYHISGIILITKLRAQRIQSARRIPSQKYLEERGVMFALYPTWKGGQGLVANGAEELLGGQIILPSISIKRTKMEMMGSIVVEPTEGGGSIALMLVLGKEHNTHLGTKMEGRKGGKVQKPYGMSVNLNDQTELLVLEDVGMLVLKVLANGKARHGHTIGTPLPKGRVVFYLIDKSEVLGFEGTKFNGGHHWAESLVGIGDDRCRAPWCALLRRNVSIAELSRNKRTAMNRTPHR